MPNPSQWDQIDRYFAGELDEDAAAEVRRYLMQHSGEHRVLQQVGTALGGGRDVVRDGDAAASWQRVSAGMRSQEGVRVLHEVSVRRSGGVESRTATERSWWSRSLRRGVWYPAIAVILAVVVGVIGWKARVFRQPSHPSFTSAYVTGNGQRANITLPDGSTVALNVASRLDVPADYLSGNHTLHLNGEALFTVLHHDGVPFTVVAGGTATRVLGTSFVVRHYTTDTTTTVAVRNGRVAVRSAVVAAAQQADVGSTGAIRVHPADATQFGFTTGVLTLNGVLFPAAIAELDRWYDADIRLGDPSLATRRVAGECAAGSLADLSDILELTFNVRVVRNGRVLTLYPK